MILSNKAQCKLCKDIVESRHRRDFKWCKCGQMYVDGGLEYLRRGAKNLDNIIELSVTTDTFDA
jgi:hypothetical protein